MDDLSREELERTRTDEPATGGDDDRDRPAILDEVLIEEISIDGMCGVY